MPLNTRRVEKLMDMSGLKSSPGHVIESDWQYVAMVLDRLFLWIFTIACVVGTGWIILCAPSLYDDKQPIDIVFSKVAPRIRRLLRN
ncbi:acetylcholine receptor subunit alpha-like 1 [Trichonephila clavipes]|nr:acetylcholine receptor subunit alpha-like 1 [Trichonephila clavipes]